MTRINFDGQQRRMHNPMHAVHRTLVVLFFAALPVLVTVVLLRQPAALARLDSAPSLPCKSTLNERVWPRPPLPWVVRYHASSVPRSIRLSCETDESLCQRRRWVIIWSQTPSAAALGDGSDILTIAMRR
jgi:hypothetical protein